MNGTLTSATFTPHVGEKFEVTAADGATFEAILTSCDETSYGSPEQWLDQVDRVPFSLVFNAPGGELLPQQIFTLRHPEIGELEVFLVPLGPGVYEAVFS